MGGGVGGLGEAEEPSVRWAAARWGRASGRQRPSVPSVGKSRKKTPRS